jgi:thioredoxin
MAINFSICISPFSKLNKNKMVKKLNMESFKNRVHNFEKNKNEWKFEGTKPCIVDFYADWCQPCKILGSILDHLSKEYDGKIDIYQVDIEAEPELSSAFSVRSIPSMLFVPMDEKPQMSAGLFDKKSLAEIIKDVLKVC